MISAETGLEQVLQTLGKLDLEDLEVVEKQLTREKNKPKSFSAPKSLLEDERFLISFDDYLALSDDEGEELKLMAYEKYRDWIDRELAKRRARWMLICGGKTIEWSPKLDDYPSRKKRHTIGRQMGYAPWTFIANPIIEESYWAAISDNDFYPSVSVAFGAENWNQEDVMKKGLQFDTDLDTGSGNIMLDYGLMRSKNIIENSVRKALVGRNLLYEFPLRIELDGGERTTKILAASS